jgi:PKD domain/FlgD Ig-like domain/Bacterial Ig domain/Putative Ig domain
VSSTSSNSIGTSVAQGITIQVNDTNQAPVLNAIGNKSAAVGVGLTFTATATDADFPVQTLAFSLTLGSPAATGATINSATGAFSWTPSATGTFPVTITVTDNGTPPLNDFEGISITVSGNNPPVLANPGSKTTNEGTAVTFTLSATDPDAGQTVSFAMTLGSPAATGATLNSATGAFAWTPVESQGPGIYPITFTATDNGTPPATSAPQSITITVNEVNVAPALTPIPDQSAQVGTALTFTATATDADLPAQTLTFSLTLGSPAATGATINSATGAFSWTPSATGTYPVTVTVMDNGTPPLSAQDGFNIVVGAVANNPPVLATVGNQTVDELATLNFTAVATDPDAGQTVSYSITLGSPAATGAAINSTTGAFAWTPTESQGPGVYPVTVTATDDGTPPLSANEGITITVNEVNTTPVVTSPGDQTVNENVALTFTVTATDADLPPQTLTFAITLGSPAATGATINSSTGAFSWTPSESQGGAVYPVSFTASDGTATSAPVGISITVNDTNSAPVLDPIGNKSTPVNTALTFTATASDTDIPAQTLLFSLTLGSPAATGATINSATGAFSWTPTASGSFPVTITVTDNGTPPLDDFEGIVISVGAVNQPPILTQPGDVTINEGDVLDFTLTATDPDGDPLTFSLEPGAPTFMTVSSAGAVHIAPGFGDSGSYTATVSVSDGQGGSDSKTFSITVVNVNQAPIADADGPYTGTINTPVHFDGSGSSDPDGDPLTFAWDFGDGGTGTGEMPDHTYTSEATFTVTLVVNDGTVDSPASTTTATITSFVGANAFLVGGNKTTRLASGKPQTCVQIEPVSNSFSVDNIDLTSIQMTFGGTSISAISGKTVVDGDKDGNGVQEIEACFSKDDLRTLFASLGSGEHMVDVTITGNLTTGGGFSATLSMRIIGTNKVFAASARPNPLNPETLLEFTTTRPGRVTVQVFDLAGRLVKTLQDETMQPGFHSVRWDGTASNGGHVASGVYYFKIASSVEGQSIVRVTVLK